METPKEKAPEPEKKITFMRLLNAFATVMIFCLEGTVEDEKENTKKDLTHKK